MGSTIRAVAGCVPLTRVTDAVRDPWLGIGSATTSLVVVAFTKLDLRDRAPAIIFAFDYRVAGD